MAANAQKLYQRYEELRLERSGFIDVWKEISRLFCPGRYRDDTSTDYHLTPYSLDSRLVNSTGVLALRSLAAGMHGGMTSPVRPWFRLIAQNTNELPEGVNRWLDMATQTLQSVLHQSNFYNAVHGLYADVGAFGTALMVETADASGIQFYLANPGEFVLDINSSGEVDTFYRRLYMTARQIVDKFPAANIPDAVKNCAKDMRNAAARFDVIHAVYPRSDFKSTNRASATKATEKPYASVYFLPGSSTSSYGGLSGLGGNLSILEESGYNDFPGFAPRWEISGSDRYGLSPAMQVLPDVKMLQSITQTVRKSQHVLVDPPLVIDQSLRATGVRLVPGGLSYFDSTRTGTTPVAPIYQPNPQMVEAGLAIMREVEETVNSGMYVDLFRVFLDDQRLNLTATEVNARNSEKLVMLGPVVERLHKELLSPLVRRTLALCVEWGAIPPLEGIDIALDIKFESVLAQAQAYALTASIEQSVAFAANAVQLDPGAFDNIDLDAAIQNYASRAGAPTSILREPQAITQIREQRAQQQAQQEEIAMGQQALQEAALAGQAAESLSKARTDNPSVLQNLLGGISGGL